MPATSLAAMLGAQLKGPANVIGVGLAQSELTNATSVAACHDTDNSLPSSPRRRRPYGELAGFAPTGLTGVVWPTRLTPSSVAHAERGPGSAPPQPQVNRSEPTHLSRGLGWHRRHQAAVDDELAAGGIRRFLAGEKQYKCRNLVGVTGAAERNGDQALGH